VAMGPDVMLRSTYDEQTVIVYTGAWSWQTYMGTGKFLICEIFFYVMAQHMCSWLCIYALK
jgi:hypothetical protein